MYVLAGEAVLKSVMGVTKKICTFLIVKNFSKNYFKKCPNYSETTNIKIEKFVENEVRLEIILFRIAFDF